MLSITYSSQSSLALSLLLLSTSLPFTSAQASPTPSPNSSDNINYNNSSGGSNTALYVIIAVVAILLILGVVVLGLSHRKKAAAAAEDGTRLDDVEAARSNARALTAGARRQPPREEGLDENGEAPPPYIARVKTHSDSDSDDEEEGSEAASRNGDARSTRTTESGAARANDAPLAPPQLNDANGNRLSAPPKYDDVVPTAQDGDQQQQQQTEVAEPTRPEATHAPDREREPSA